MIPSEHPICPSCHIAGRLSPVCGRHDHRLDCGSCLGEFYWRAGGWHAATGDVFVCACCCELSSEADYEEDGDSFCACVRTCKCSTYVDSHDPGDGREPECLRCAVAADAYEARVDALEMGVSL